jgi:ActR/RegA family two-component response regulator
MPVASAALTLEFLLVSNNASTLKTVKKALDNVGSNLSCTTSAGAARFHISHHRLDGIIIDLDVDEAVELIAFIREAGSNRRAFVFVCVESMSASLALKGGANVLLHKPLTAEFISQNVNTFKNIMASERRRYFRHHVTILITLTANGASQAAMIDNLSEGGAAILVRNPFERTAVIDFSFELPFGPRVTGSAQVMWTNKEGIMGVEFRVLHGRSKEDLSSWLCQRALAGQKT